MKFGVLVFPGSNCDHDTYNVIAEIAHQPVTFLWHDSEDLQGVDAVLVPGGFAYGDYLRTGAIARFSPVMGAVQKFAAAGGLVLGICNGFQILTEAGLLPGALMRNAGLKYICKQVHLRTETTNTPFTNFAVTQLLPRIARGDPAALIWQAAPLPTGPRGFARVGPTHEWHFGFGHVRNRDHADDRRANPDRE